MNDADVEQTIQRYAVSWYAETDHIDPSRIAGMGARKAAERELDDPAVLTAAMAENIAEAATNLNGVKDRYERARGDGLFDPDVIQSVAKRLKAQWIGAVEMQKGDLARAIAELAHWQAYFVWARAKEKGSSSSRPPIADTRLPPERETAEEAAAEQEAVAP